MERITASARTRSIKVTSYIAEAAQKTSVSEVEAAERDDVVKTKG